jgi:hypothetical protein
MHFPQKSASGHVMPMCIFASDEIYGSGRALRCIQAMKCQCTIVHAQVGLVEIAQKAHRDTLC